MKVNRIKSRAFNFYLNPFGLAAALALGFYTLPVIAADNLEAPVAQPANTETSRMDTPAETLSDHWQSPVIIEFNKLDTSGNGLLLPGEASKGKAFNKKNLCKS